MHTASTSSVWTTESSPSMQALYGIVGVIVSKSLILRKAKACLVVELKDLLSTRDEASEALCLLETGDLVSTMTDLWA